jgi:hypothetical protein
MKKCLVRNVIKKHKYIYILGKNDKETKKLRDKFYEKHGYGCDHEIIHDHYNSKITYEEAKTRLNLT